uniref:ribonuclease H n=1 Tax=Myripristis murdjan TaxID=586833 RepID=A0A667XGE4_9TELE
MTRWEFYETATSKLRSSVFFKNVYALWFRLQNVGITGRIYNVIVNMYNHIKSCVFMDGAKSDFFVSLTGVRQGENLSPILFALFINDLEEYLFQNKCEPASCGDNIIDSYIKILVLLYADDSIAMATSKEGLQKAIDHMCCFCKKWKLKINSSKTKVTVFGRHKTDVKNCHFFCDGEVLEAVHSFKYLGVVFNFNGSFKIAIEDLHKRASRAMFALLCKCRKFNLPIDIRLELFDRLVSPVMLYAC